MHKRLLIAGIVATCALLTCSSAFAHSLMFETLTLDTYSPLHTGAAGPVSTTNSLGANRLYLVTVQGTWSAWSPSLWTGSSPPNVACGSPEPAPLFPSPDGFMTGPVGQDAETVFAGIERFSCENPYPRHDTGFQMDLGSGFTHHDPFDGPQSTPSRHHLYAYVVRGQGAPISFEQLDSATGDNYGEYHITVVGGFTSQGDCVNYFDSESRR